MILVLWTGFFVIHNKLFFFLILFWDSVRILLMIYIFCIYLCADLNLIKLLIFFYIIYWNIKYTFITIVIIRFVLQSNFKLWLSELHIVKIEIFLFNRKNILEYLIFVIIVSKLQVKNKHYQFDRIISPKLNLYSPQQNCFRIAKNFKMFDWS